MNISRKDSQSYNINVGGAGGWNFVNESEMHLGDKNVMRRCPDLAQRLRTLKKINWKINREKYLAISMRNLERAKIVNTGSHRSDETKLKMSESNKIRWQKPENFDKHDAWLKRIRSRFEVVSPSGETFITVVLELFCREHNLPYTTIWKTSKGSPPSKRGRGKGWICRLI